MIILDANLKAKAACGQYLGFPINAMVEFDGKFLVASDDGLFEHVGTQDNENNVDAFFKLNTIDLGVHTNKKIRFFYLGVNSTGPLEMTVSTEKVSECTIPIPYKGPGYHEVKVPCPRSVYGVFFTIKVGNGGNGADFSIDYIKALPIILGR